MNLFDTFQIKDGFDQRAQKIFADPRPAKIGIDIHRDDLAAMPCFRPVAAHESGDADQIVARKRAEKENVRDVLMRVLGQYPSQVAAVLKLDPSLLSSEPYMSGYKALVTYLKEHPDFNKTFDVALHLGTLIGVVAYFRV